MKTRIISAAVALCLFIPCLYFSKLIIFDLLVCAMCLVAAYELIKCVGLHKKPQVIIPTALISAGLPLTVRVFDKREAFLQIYAVVLFIYIFWMLCCAVFSKGGIIITDSVTGAVMVMYALFGLCSILLLRSSENGAFVYLLVFVSAWMSDTGAYFTGVFFGKHKLIPDVSPKKTVEGAIGGVVICMLSFLLYGFIVSKAYGKSADYLLFAAAGLLLSVISMCGDLVASLLKRKYNVKDYGNIMPGHGGVMDRFDSVIATSAFLYLMFLIPGWESRFVA
ncbi:MAG: phosphatidate cytidylyltransferase [Clostridia bacterium]|nr:phosphatidate cytidylyltransferase [Clostridia bacterium]